MSAPLPPTPRQLLAAAQALAAGQPLSVAAFAAGLRTATLRAYLDDPEVAELLADCAAQAAQPKAEQDERLAKLLRAAVERALQDGRLGAIPAAMRLLGLLPGRAPTPPDHEAAAPTIPADSAPAATAWGLYPDGQGGWRGPDGRPAMPGRALRVIDAADGPVRVLDDAPGEVEPELVELLAKMEPDEAAPFNHAAYPWGGPQWDPVTRTLWFWEAPEEAGPDPESEEEDDRAEPATTAPALTILPPAAASDPLQDRLDHLLACGAPTTAAERDLADAVCFLLWPRWPAYAGVLDLGAVRKLLASRLLSPTVLTRLAGSACAHRADPVTWPAPEPAPRAVGRARDPPRPP